MELIFGSHNPMLVVFSYFVAVAASYTALDVTGRISSTTGVRRWLWLMFGALAMGMGIWSMHFVGMLAFSLPILVPYDTFVVILSMLPSIIGSFIALYIVGFSSKLGAKQLIGGGVLLAAGVSSMHYIGMAAMQIRFSYDKFYFLLSILIAIVASISALWLSFYFRKDGTRGVIWKKLGSGLIMGGAIAGLHYTGMKAAQFYNELCGDTSGILLNQTWLAYFISGGTLFTLGLCLFGIYISKSFSMKNSEIEFKSKEIYRMNQELLQMNEHLEKLVQERTAQLEKAHDEAIRANHIKSQFLANMSHELRTPLNAIIGYSEMLIEDAEDLGEEVFVEDLGKVRKAGKQLLTLINDILDISKVEAGKMEVYFENCELSDIVQDVANTVRPLFESNGNSLEIRNLEGEMKTDITKLRQILMNLLSNANKFTHKGSVILEVRNEERDGQSGYCFVVTDTGIGMSSEQIDRLFQPFVQADSSTTRKYGGTGLGLAISSRFCHIMGGVIEVESELDVGSVFTCWLPNSSSLAQSSEPNLKADIEVEASDFDENQPCILLIDDEPLNEQLMRRYLAKEGWKLVFAENGHKGLALAKKHRPQVICLDILMPGMDGWSVLSELKNDPELADIPVVIWSMMSDKQLGYALGASDYIIKPVDRDRLIQVMEKYIGRRDDHLVLVIEDDAATSELMTRLLRKEGFSVAQGVNGRVALEQMASRMPALILLDLMMPEMDGFQFITELRKVEAWREIPIVVMTAKSITGEERQKLNGYVNNIVQKGTFDYKDLLEEIGRIMTPKKNLS